MKRDARNGNELLDFIERDEVFNVDEQWSATEDVYLVGLLQTYGR
jgi:hypothetical protein